MKILFLASGEFARPSLTMLADPNNDFELKIISQPDQGKGRGRKPGSTPIKMQALETGLEVMTPADINSPNVIEELRSFAPEVLLLIDFGVRLKQPLIELPHLAAVNLHPSLLPAYRGPAPMPWALINGEPVTGVTTQLIGDKIDCGDILLQEPTFILDHETLPQLAQRLSLLGAGLVKRTLMELAAGRLQPQPQNENLASKAPKLRKEDGLLNWNLPAGVLFNRIRGLNPWPGTYTFLRGKRVKIIAARPSSETIFLPAGQLKAVGNHLYVGCAKGSLLEIEKLQAAGKPVRAAADFLPGLRLKENETFSV